MENNLNVNENFIKKFTNLNLIDKNIKVVRSNAAIDKGGHTFIQLSIESDGTVVHSLLKSVVPIKHVVPMHTTYWYWKMIHVYLIFNIYIYVERKKK